MLGSRSRPVTLIVRFDSDRQKLTSAMQLSGAEAPVVDVDVTVDGDVARRARRARRPRCSSRPGSSSGRRRSRSVPGLNSSAYRCVPDLVRRPAASAIASTVAWISARRHARIEDLTLGPKSGGGRRCGCRGACPYREHGGGDERHAQRSVKGSEPRHGDTPLDRGSRDLAGYARRNVNSSPPADPPRPVDRRRLPVGPGDVEVDERDRRRAVAVLPFNDPSRGEPPRQGRRLARRHRARVVVLEPARSRRRSAGCSTSGTRSRRSDGLHRRRRSLFQTGQTFFAGLSYYGILRAAYPGEVELWPIVTAYAVGVAMNNFLPANIGTFVTLLMFVAIIPACDVRRRRSPPTSCRRSSSRSRAPSSTSTSSSRCRARSTRTSATSRSTRLGRSRSRRAPSC